MWRGLWELLLQSKEVLRLWDNGRIISVPELLNSYIISKKRKILLGPVK